MPRKTNQLKDGDTVIVQSDDIVRDVCCVCGAAHLVKYAISGNTVIVTTWLDPLYKDEKPQNQSTKAK